MKVNEWFNNGQQYQEGIAIYSQLKGAKPNLIRLFFKKQTKNNEEKLLYELSKYREEDNHSKGLEIMTQIEEVKKVKTDSKSEHQFFYRLNELHPSLHEQSRNQRDLFQQAISLKLRLNELHELEEGIALEICLEIEDVFDEIDSIQKVLKHYVDHKVILNLSKSSFDDLSPAQLLQRRNNKRATLSKLKSKICKLEQDLKTELPLSLRKKKLNQIEKNKAKLINIENDIINLTKLIVNRN